MKKIAVCLSGELRHFNHDLVKEGFKKFIEILNPDIFISTWNHIGTSMNHGWIDPSESKNKNLNTENLLKKVYNNIVKMEIEDYNEWYDSIDPYLKNVIYSNPNIKDHRTVNSYSQLYKIYKSNFLKKNYEKDNGFKYDIVLRVRPDSLFVKNLDLNIENKTIYNINTGGAFFPNRIYDIFFYGDSKSIDIVSDTYLEIIKLINDNFNNGLCKRDACRLLYLQSINNNINVLSTKDRPCDIWRGNMSFDDYFNSLI